MNLLRYSATLCTLAIVGMLVMTSCKSTVGSRVDCEGLFNEVLNSRLNSEWGDVTGEAIKADQQLGQAYQECKPALEKFVRNGTTDQRILAIDHFMASKDPDASDILIDVLSLMDADKREDGMLLAICTAFNILEVKNKDGASVQLRKQFKPGKTRDNVLIFNTLAKLSPLQAMAFTREISESKNLKEVQEAWPLTSFIKILSGTGNKECVEYAKGLEKELRAATGRT